MSSSFKSILGIRFFTGELDELLRVSEGKFVVVPSAPTLADLPIDPAYRESVENSDFAITDSGLMVLLWKVLTGQSLVRISGLKFLRALLAGGRLSPPGDSFWIMPSAAEMEINLAWLNQNGIQATRDDCFVAPLYPRGPLADQELMRRIEARRARYVIINIGGGVQERLGYYLRNNLSYRPAILCVGAAIAFITGAQARIPVWADAWLLGWFFRCLQAPAKFIPRYGKALRLIPLLARYRGRSVTTCASDPKA